MQKQELIGKILTVISLPLCIISLLLMTLGYKIPNLFITSFSMYIISNILLDGYKLIWEYIGIVLFILSIYFGMLQTNITNILFHVFLVLSGLCLFLSCYFKK
jgi:hypothetical protein